MTPPRPPSQAPGETIGALIARLVADGKRLASAEIAFYKQLALGKLAGVKVAAILLVVAVLLVQAALTTLLVGIGLAIARLFTALGSAGGVIVAAVLGLIVAGLLVRAAVGRLATAFKPDDQGAAP